MPDLSVSLSGYAIDLEADEDGRLIATSTDFPVAQTFRRRWPMQRTRSRLSFASGSDGARR